MKFKLLVTSVFILLLSCGKKNKKSDPEPVASFDKQAMLTNMADNVILPNYNAFKISLDSLISAYNVFKSSDAVTDFQRVKQQFQTAYLNYQKIDLFEFGPAETVNVRMNFNVFPTDSAQIKTNIASNSYDLEAALNLDAKGFPALDYLFFGNNKPENSVVAGFTSSPNQKAYVSAILNNMFTRINVIINSWNSSYRTAFINSLGTDVGSSIGFLINQMNFELDYLKNAKIGTPLGKKTLGIAIPDKCEAYYSARSIEYALETLTLVQRTYSGGYGSGFDDYLDHLKADYNGVPLTTQINNQFNAARNKLTAITGPLSTAVVSNVSQVDAAYLEIVKLLVLLKTDVPSHLGVIITYQDGDGD